MILLSLSLALAALAGPSRAYEEADRHDGGATHQALMAAAADLLAADGHADLASFVRSNLATLQTGSIRADGTLWDSREHYMDPESGSGLAGFRSAGELAAEKAAAASQAWRSSDYWAALRDLGWVVHLIQDLTVPHHARLTPLDSHAEYEAWVGAHLHELPPAAAGLYGLGAPEEPLDPLPWLRYAGSESSPRFPLVDGPDGTGDNDYAAAARVLVPLAASLSAGYLKSALASLTSDPPRLAPIVPALGRPGEPLEMSCLSCGDDGPSLLVAWDFGDGTRAEGARVEHAYASPGTYVVAVVATDVAGHTASATANVTIGSQGAGAPSSGGAPWGWLALAALVGGSSGLGGLVVVLRRRGARAGNWTGRNRGADPPRTR